MTESSAQPCNHLVTQWMAQAGEPYVYRLFCCVCGTDLKLETYFVPGSGAGKGFWDAPVTMGYGEWNA